MILMLWMSVTFAPQAVPSGFTVDAHGASLSNGTAIACTPDGRVFVAQIGGTIRVIRNGELKSTPFHQLTVDHPPATDRGLLGLCLDPGFATNGYVYAYFATPTPAPHNCVRRLKAATPDSDVSDGTETPIVDLEDLGADTMHNGGAIQFGSDGKLYIAVGDNAVPALSQSLNSRFGKVLRYNADGSIPSDNPTSFPGIGGTPSGEFRAIWSVGLRNVYRFAIQPGTMRMYLNDVGAASFEEINEGVAGMNYGWQGGDTDGARGLVDFTDPVFQYGHSGTTPAGRAITGGAFYNPAVTPFPASYVGKYFFADYVTGFIRTLDPAAPATSESFATGVHGIVDLQVGSDGALYYLDGTGTPGVYRISYAASPPPDPDPAPSPAPAPAPGTAKVGKKSSTGCGATGAEAALLLVLLGAIRGYSRRE